MVSGEPSAVTNACSQNQNTVAGASLELLGRLLGLSRQRVSVIAKPRQSG
jgi:hypothetical protein